MGSKKSGNKLKYGEKLSLVRHKVPISQKKSLDEHIRKALKKMKQYYDENKTLKDFEL